MALALMFLSTAGFCQTNELRGMWVNAWNAGFRDASQVTTLVNNLRAANMNAVIPQVRRRGDSLYQSNYEPFASGLSPSNFDALGDLISKAHNTNNGQYIEVHAWLVTYHIWSGATNATTPVASHPLKQHPDWLLQDVNGEVFIGNQYTFDPGHPEVQRHTFNVAMDIVTNYNVDGINFDYIRYSSANEGYNPVSVARFNQRYGRTGQPAPTDAAWKQFRRDQITGLLRKVYLNAIAVKPHLKISCDTITWAPGPTSLAAWYSSSAAWNSILQDWRGWMEEGIMDYNIPMNYFRETTHPTDYRNWLNFIVDHQYNRQAVIGPGVYLNNQSNAIVQLRRTRVASPAGNKAVGVVGYDYNTPHLSGAGQFATFRTYLTSSPNAHDPLAPGIFSQPATIPPMPWKVAPTKGHLMGNIFGGTTNNALDGALVRLVGASNRIQTNDATGFYGFVDLTPGNYTVSANFPGFSSRTNHVTIMAGVVTSQDLLLSTNGPPVITSPPASRIVAQGSNVTFNVSLNGTPPFAYQWRWHGTNLPGATQASFTRNSAQPAHAGPYTVVVTNSLGSATSEVATLTVIVPPSLGEQPVSQSVTQSVDVTFTVSASGSEPFTYFWRHNGSLIPGTTGSSYTRFNVQPADEGNYSVIVSNFAGTATSTNAVLIVQQAPVPPSIGAQPLDLTVFAGQTATFTVTANGATPLAYQWQFNSANLPGATTSQLVLNNTQTNQAGGYSVAITNAFGWTNSRVATLLVDPVFTPAGLKVLWILAPGSRPYLTVSALPNERGMAYNPVTHRLILVSRLSPSVHVLDAETGADLWTLDKTGVTGGTYPLLMTGVADDGAVYAANLTTAGTTTAFKLYRWANDAASTVPTLAFNGDPGAGSNQRWGDTLDVRGAGPNTQILIGSRASNVVAVLTTTNGTHFTARMITVPAAPNGAFGLGIAFGEGNTFWGKANSHDLRQVAFNLAMGAGTILRAHGSQDFPSTIAPIGVSTGLNLLGGINVGVTGNNFRLFDLTPTNGTPVFIASTNFASDNDNTGSGTGAVDFGHDRVYALGGNNGLLAMQITPVIAPPQILAGPESHELKAGTNVTFTVLATGSAPLHYQWRFNATNAIPDATNSWLTLPSVNWSDAGEYAVTVTNTAGTDASSPALLTVLPPEPSQIDSVTVLPDGRVEIIARGDAGNYWIEASTNLVDWEEVLLLTNTNGSFLWLDFLTNAQQRFYRARFAP